MSEERHFDEGLSWVVHLLDASHLEGDQGLYFRSAKALAALTKSKHSIILVPAAEGALRVVGCEGFPTTRLGHVSVDKGIIGRAYRELKAARVGDVHKDADYVEFDREVNAELAVPILNSERTAVEFMVNLESATRRHYADWHSRLVYRLSEVILRCRDRLLRGHRVNERNECLARVLDEVPDEVMVIDDQYRVVYANKVKRQAFPDLDRYLTEFERENPGSPLAVGRSGQKAGRDETCYWLIENQENRCPLCVCRKAMISRRVVQECYKPRLDFMVELSAAPVIVDGHVLGCVETARRITQRERVIEYAPLLLKALDERQLLRLAVDLLHGELRYSRVRLYSVVTELKQLKGEFYAGQHENLTPDSFATHVRSIPEPIAPYLLKDAKAGLLAVNGGQQAEETQGYWRVYVSRGDLATMDPTGTLGLEKVREVIVVPLVADDRRWAIMLDSQECFRHDDLQALTVFAKITSAALEAAQRNKLRFKLAVLGETGFGPVHAIEIPIRASNPKGALDALRGTLGLLAGKASRNAETLCAAHALNGLSKILEDRAEIPASGVRDVEEWVKQLASSTGLRGEALNILYDIAQVSPRSGDSLVEWTDMLKGCDMTWLAVFAGLKSLAISLISQEKASREVGMLAEGMRRIVSPLHGMEPQPALYNVLDIIDLVVRILLPKAERQAVKIVWQHPVAPILVRLEASQVLLAWLALLDNAIRAASMAGCSATVTITAEKAGRDLAVTISNNGKRVPPDREAVLGKVPFTTDPSGTGLGLLFAYDWIEAIGGQVTHRFDPSSGTTKFTTSGEWTVEAGRSC